MLGIDLFISLGYNADIICLQEVDKKVFEYDLKPILGKSGFVGLLRMKTGEVAEGSATFFRQSKFRYFDYLHFCYIGKVISPRVSI